MYVTAIAKNLSGDQIIRKSGSVYQENRKRRTNDGGWTTETMDEG